MKLIPLTQGKFAQVGVDKKLIYLGTFEDEIIAAEVYNKAAINHHGQFANLNKI